MAHAGSSSTIDNLADANLDWLRGVAKGCGAQAMVRPGIGLYGYCLPIEGAQSHVCNQLKPVMTWKTSVMSLQDINPGDTVGYNATFVAQRSMRLAVLPVGYSDGLRRELSGSNDRPGGWVIVRGQESRHRRPSVDEPHRCGRDRDSREWSSGTRICRLLGDGVTAGRSRASGAHDFVRDSLRSEGPFAPTPRRPFNIRLYAGNEELPHGIERNSAPHRRHRARSTEVCRSTGQCWQQGFGGHWFWCVPAFWPSRRIR